MKGNWTARTLRNGLVLVVVAALLPMSILSVWQGRAAWQDARAIAANQLRANAWLIAESEREVFTMARQAVQFASAVPAVQNIDRRCSKLLADTLIGTAGIVNLTRSDASGQLRCSAAPSAGELNFAAQTWWQQAVKVVGFSLSAPMTGPISKKRVLMMGLRIQAPDGNHDGLVTAAISLDSLLASLARRGAADPRALIAIVDANGAIIISNKNGVFPISNNVIGEDLPTPAVAQDGTAWLYATAPLHGKDLTIVYARPTDDVFAAARWQVRQSIILPLVAMLLASLAIWTGTHWLVVRWLRKLQDLTAQFGRGDFSGSRAVYIRAPREIALLSDDLHTMAETIDQRDAALNTALTAKTELTREVNHRVKNNLQIVTSLLTLQADRVADAYARDALGQARARIAALGLIHRVLYEHDTHNALGTVDMPLLMDELCPQLRSANRTQKNVDLLCTCGAFQVTVDQAVPLTLFIVEVVTNAFRHAYPDDRNGKILLDMTAAEGRVDLTIIDDGVGYSLEDPIGKMGFELINAFATQLGATLDIVSDASGTNVTLRYALTQY